MIVAFPLMVYLGACGSAPDGSASPLCKFLGDISYPVYVVHYPFMYLYYAYVWNHSLTFAQSWHWAVAVFVASIIVAWICMRCYDIPVRRWLTQKTASKSPSNR